MAQGLEGPLFGEPPRADGPDARIVPAEAQKASVTP
jgi:hypothetical protein